MEMASKRTWTIADENECECVRFNANRNADALETLQHIHISTHTEQRYNHTSGAGSSNVYFLHDIRMYNTQKNL